MTNPFLTTVGLKGVTTPEPGVLVNDLPGISTELVTALSNTDFADAAAVWAKVQRAALDKLRSQVEGELSRSADFRYISERTIGLEGERTGMVLLPAAVYRGFVVRAPISANDELYIQRLHLDSATDHTVDTTIKVFSATGVMLITKEVTVWPDYNEFAIEFGMRSQFGMNAIVFVGIDCTSLALRVLGTGQCWESSDYKFTLEPHTVATSGPYALGNLTPVQTTTLMLEADVRRSLLEVIGRYADRLTWAYAHVCGSLLMAEKLGSANVNLFTNTNRAFTEDREAKFMDEAGILIKPIARDMLKELVRTHAVSDRADRPFDSGYAMGSFV